MTPGQRKLLLWLTCIAQLAVCVFLIARWEWVLRTGQPFKFRTQPVDPYDPFRGRYVALQFEENSLSIFKPAPTVTLEREQTVYVTLETGTNGFAHFSGLQEEKPDGNEPFIKVSATYVEDSPRLRPVDILDPDGLARRIWTADDSLSSMVRSEMNEYDRKQLENHIVLGTNSPNLASTLAELLERLQYNSEFVTIAIGREKEPDAYDAVQFDQRRARERVLEAYADFLSPIPAQRVHLKLPYDRYYMDENQAPAAEQAYTEHSRANAEDRTYAIIRVRNGLAVIENLMIGDKPVADYLCEGSAQELTP